MKRLVPFLFLSSCYLGPAPPPAIDLAAIQDGAECEHVSVCKDETTLANCIFPGGHSPGYWSLRTCVRCVPAGEVSWVGDKFPFPVCLIDGNRPVPSEL